MRGGVVGSRDREEWVNGPTSLWAAWQIPKSFMRFQQAPAVSCPCVSFRKSNWMPGGGGNEQM